MNKCTLFLLKCPCPKTNLLDFFLERQRQEIIKNNSTWKINYLLNMSCLSNFKPGKILICYMIEDAIKKGYKVFDFPQGNEDYKYSRTNDEI